MARQYLLILAASLALGALARCALDPMAFQRLAEWSR